MCQHSTQVYEVFIRHPDTLEILIELLSRDHEMEYVMPLLSQACIIFTNLSYDELICKQMFQKVDVLTLMNELLKKFFLSNYFGEIDLFRGQNFAQIEKILSFLSDMIWVTNNLLTHEINYKETKSAIQVGLAETYHNIIQVYQEFKPDILDFDVWSLFIWGFSLMSKGLITNQSVPYYFPFLHLLEK